MDPMVRSNVCLNCNPQGLEKEIEKQFAYFENMKFPGNGPKNVLIIGGSMGYGLSSRIASCVGFRANTISVSYEKAATDTKQGTPGYYNNLYVDKKAKAMNLVSISIEGDAFSDEIKNQVIEKAKLLSGKIDLVIYSIASGVRKDPVTGIEYRSALKPIGAEYAGKAVDYLKGTLSDISIQSATDDEIKATVKVMGGEDWERWIDFLLNANVLAQDVKTVAYSYIGPEFSRAIYRDGTIGKAKEDLENRAKIIREKLPLKEGAWVSVNKALVTRASAVIPGIALYIATLFKVMKNQKNHEGCPEQIYRLYVDRLYSGKKVPVDSNGLIRIDEFEMDNKVQDEVSRRLLSLNENNLEELTDMVGVRTDFLAASGFELN